MTVSGGKPLHRPWLWAGCLLLLAGCTWLADLPLTLPGNPTATPESPPAPGATPTVTETVMTPVTVAPVPTGAQDTQTLALQLWVPDFLDPNAETAAAEVLAAQVDSFLDVTNDVQVQVVAKSDTGAGSLYSLISSAYAVAPSILPDVVVLGQYDLIAAADAGLVQSLSSALPADAGFFPTALSALTTQQGVWGFPYVAKAEHMAYSADAGPMAEAVPTTEAEGTPEAVQTAGATGMAITSTLPVSWTNVISGSYQMLLPAGPADGLAGDTLLAIYLGSGGRVTDQNGQPALDRSSLERVYSFLGAMRDNDLLDAEVALGLPDAAASWALYETGVGQLTPVPAGAYWQSVVGQTSGEETPAVQRRASATLPSWAPTASGDPIIVLKVWGLAVITQDPARREAALGLARWLVSAQHMADLTFAAALVPTRKAAVEAWPIEPEGAAMLTKLLANSVPALPPTVDSAVRRALQTGLTALLQSDATTPEAAAGQALTALRR